MADHVPDSLAVHHRPICITFALFGDGDVMVVDPSLKEEDVSVGRLVVALNAHREVCGLHKPGGVALPPGRLVECIRIASAKVAELSGDLDSSWQNLRRAPVLPTRSPSN